MAPLSARSYPIRPIEMDDFFSPLDVPTRTTHRFLVGMSRNQATLVKRLRPILRAQPWRNRSSGFFFSLCARNASVCVCVYVRAMKMEQEMSAA